MSDTDFSKVFEDRRLFSHDRFRQLNDRAKKADSYEKKQQEAELQRLEDEKKFKELADLNKAEATDFRTKWEDERTNNALIIEMQKQGVVDQDVVLKLIDRSKLTIAENGVAGAAEAISSLLEQKPYLKSNGGGSKNVGSSVNPGGENNATTTPNKFTRSQINDPKFFREHEQEILAAMKLPGGIIED